MYFYTFFGVILYVRAPNSDLYIDENGTFVWSFSDMSQNCSETLEKLTFGFGCFHIRFSFSKHNENFLDYPLTLDLPSQFLLLDFSVTSWNIVFFRRFCSHKLNVGIATNTVWVATVAPKMILTVFKSAD